VRRTDTQTAMTTIHFASPTPHAKCNNNVFTVAARHTSDLGRVLQRSTQDFILGVKFVPRWVGTFQELCRLSGIMHVARDNQHYRVERRQVLTNFQIIPHHATRSYISLRSVITRYSQYVLEIDDSFPTSVFHKVV